MSNLVDFRVGSKRIYADELTKQTGIRSEDDLIAVLSQRARELCERVFGKCKTHWFIDTNYLPIFFETEEEAEAEASKRGNRHPHGWRPRVHPPLNKSKE